MSYYREFSHGDWTVAVEDDDKVGYAYLVIGGAIVADVWLYNRTPAPISPPWASQGETMPFANAADFVRDEAGLETVSPEQLAVVWPSSADALSEVVVCLDDRPIAGLWPGSKPGWSAQAKRDGPLALAPK